MPRCRRGARTRACPRAPVRAEPRTPNRRRLAPLSPRASAERMDTTNPHTPVRAEPKTLMLAEDGGGPHAPTHGATYSNDTAMPPLDADRQELPRHYSARLPKRTARRPSNVSTAPQVRRKPTRRTSGARGADPHRGVRSPIGTGRERRKTCLLHRPFGDEPTSRCMAAHGRHRTSSGDRARPRTPHPRAPART